MISFNSVLLGAYFIFIYDDFDLNGACFFVGNKTHDSIFKHVYRISSIGNINLKHLPEERGDIRDFRIVGVLSQYDYLEYKNIIEKYSEEFV